MIRLGRAEEAQPVLQEVHSQSPCEDATLQAMSICYRETHRPELTCQAYEAAVAKDPTNEEFLSYLFMSYVRIGNYRKQQQSAMALFKVKPSKNPYYFWLAETLHHSLANLFFNSINRQGRHEYPDASRRQRY